MEILGQDVRYGARMLVKSPATTGVAILSLALGVGANTAIFSLINALILRPLPIREPAKLVRIFTTTAANPDRESSLSLAMYQQLRENQQVFSDLFAWEGRGIANIEANGVKYVAGRSDTDGVEGTPPPISDMAIMLLGAATAISSDETSQAAQKVA